MQNAVIKISGMEHEGSADELNALLSNIDGISDVRVSLLDAQVTLKMDENLVSAHTLVHTLEAAGYSSYPNPDQQEKTSCGGCCGGGCGG